MATLGGMGSGEVAVAKAAFVIALGAGITLAVACSGDGHPANGSIGNVVNDPTACATEGAVEGCRISLGIKNGVESCATGTATCTNGHWSACSAGGTKGATFGGLKVSGPGAVASSVPASTGGGLHFLADPIDASSSAQLCVNGTGDPCDAYCWGWDDEGGAPPAPPSSGNGDVGDLPSGWYSATTDNPCGVPGHPRDCQFDQCCPANGGACADWATAPVTGNCDPTTNNIAPGCAGKPDFTAGVACDDPVTTHTILDVCNRGGADQTTGTLKVGVGNLTPQSFWPFGPGGGYCKVDMAMHPLLKGTCFKFDAIAPPAGVQCFGINFGPQNRVFVNGGGGNSSSNDPMDISLPECTGSNNFGAANHQVCGSATASGSQVYTCGSYSALTSGSDQTAPNKCHPNNGHTDDCQYDTCCYANDKQCINYDITNTGYCKPSTICSGAQDYTASVACVDSATDVHVRVCNRGTSDATTGTFNVGFGAVGSNPNSYPFTAAGYCTWDWSTVGTLEADGCADLNVSQGQLDGVNVDCSSIGLTSILRNVFLGLGRRAIFVDGHPNANNNTDVVIADCNGANNWSAYEPGLACSGCPVPAPNTGPQSFDYTGVCDSGSHVKWRNFVFDVSGGEVQFKASTDFTEIDGSVAPTSTPVLIADPPTAPATSACHYNSPAGVCPIDLGTLLGSNAYGQVLHLDVIPVTGFALKWSISYDCVPYE